MQDKRSEPKYDRYSSTHLSIKPNPTIGRALVTNKAFSSLLFGFIVVVADNIPSAARLAGPLLAIMDEPLNSHVVTEFLVEDEDIDRGSSLQEMSYWQQHRWRSGRRALAGSFIP